MLRNQKIIFLLEKRPGPADDSIGSGIQRVCRAAVKLVGLGKEDLHGILKRWERVCLKIQSQRGDLITVFSCI